MRDFDMYNNMQNPQTQHYDFQKIGNHFSQYMGGLSENDQQTLTAYIGRDMDAFHLSTEKTKIILQLFSQRQRIDDKDVERILLYLEHLDSVCGWHEGMYVFDNKCFRESDGRCRRSVSLTDVDVVEDVLNAIGNIFFYGDSGKIALYVFSYCLSALFTSILLNENVRLPYFLQIACEKGSEVYQLIKEIVEICDVNTGIRQSSRCDINRVCSYSCLPWHPTRRFEEEVESIIRYKDIPVIIDGSTNDSRTLYDEWLREAALIPKSRNRINSKNRFNVMPIFITPKIKLDYSSVVSMNLLGIDNRDEYADCLKFIRKYKTQLASWVYRLVTNHKDKNAAAKPEPYSQKRRYFYNLISEASRNFLKGDNRNLEISNTGDAENAAVLSVFFEQFLRTMAESFAVTKEVVFNGIFADKKERTLKEVIMMFSVASEYSLTNLQRLYSPVARELFRPTILDKTNNPKLADTRKTRERAMRWASEIHRLYESYNVGIDITEITILSDRVVLDVKPLPGTRKNQIFRFSSEIQSLGEFKYFNVSNDGLSVKLAVSDNPLKEKSLINILENPEYQKSDMKIPYGIGYDIMGNPRVVDVAMFPHLLIGGESGFGKSTALVCLLTSIVCGRNRSKTNLVILDLGNSDMGLFDNLPIMSAPVINDRKTGMRALLKLKEELERRESVYQKDKKAFNAYPYIVCLIDEFPKLFDVSLDRNERKVLESAVSTIITRGRNARVHLILAIIDPTTKNTGHSGISNIPARIALHCSSHHMSQVIINEPGAEKLMGRGNMLFKSPSTNINITNIQGANITEVEIKKLLEKVMFSEEINNKFELDLSDNEQPQKVHSVAENVKIDPIADIIIRVLSLERVSINWIQKKFQKGYSTASKDMERLECLNIVGAAREKLSRVVIPKCVDDVINNIEVMKLLLENGMTREDIEASFSER